MKAQLYYELEPDDAAHKKRLGEDINMLRFVFTHHPWLALTPREVTPSGKRRKAKDHYNPHARIFNGTPFTAEHLWEWSNWVDEVINKGWEAIAKQLPAYREGHKQALNRFREDADAFLNLFAETQCRAL